jgi:hypothetical protein
MTARMTMKMPVVQISLARTVPICTQLKTTTSNWPTLFGQQLLTNDNMASLRMMKAILFVLYWSLSYQPVSSVRTSLSHWSLLLLVVVFDSDTDLPNCIVGGGGGGGTCCNMAIHSIW